MITLPNITEPPWRREEHYVGIDLTHAALYGVALPAGMDIGIAQIAGPDMRGAAR